MISQGITVLGSTGSIGESTLDVLQRHQERFHVVALSAHTNLPRLAEQCARHDARYAAIADTARTGELQSALNELGCATKIIAGQDALSTAATMAVSSRVLQKIRAAGGSSFSTR